MIIIKETKVKNDSTHGFQSRKKTASFLRRMFSLLLALLLVGSNLPLQQVLAHQQVPIQRNEESNLQQMNVDENDLASRTQVAHAAEFEAIDVDDFDSIMMADLFLDPDRVETIQARRANQDVLTQTLGPRLGVVGFEGDDALPSGNALVDVEIHFVTPSATALRLLSDHGIDHEIGISRESLSTATLNFEEVARSAHEAFADQLSSVAVPFGAPAIDIYQSHHLYWNGVFARVPASSLEAVAALPEVFAVSPVTVFSPIGEVDREISPTRDITDDSDDLTEPDASDQEDLAENSVASEIADYSQFEETTTSFDPSGDFFNRSILEQFEIARIRTELELTGEGLQIAVLDTGIDWMHPIFESHRIPSTTSPTATDARFGYASYTVPGWDFINDDPYPFEALPEQVSPFPGGGSGATNHGTHVAGTIYAIAPGATFYHYRVLHGTTPGHVISAGIERAILDGADIVNMSLGGASVSPVNAQAHMINVASLDGVLFVISAGNSGPNPQTIGSPGIASLALTVANGQLGGWQPAQFNESTVNDNLVPIQLHGWSPGTVLDDDLVSVVELDADGNANFTWLGQLSNLPEVPTQAWLDANFPDLDLSNQIAVINRGGTSFTSMRALAQALNAAALIIVNNEPTDVFLSGTTISGFLPANQIPIFSVRLSDVASFGGNITTIPHSPVEGVIHFGSLGVGALPPNILNPNSSRGPLAVFSHIKPDITGPGTNIFSTVPTFWQYPNHPELWSDYTEAYGLASGTSMSAPAVAGVAALMLEQNPSFEPYEIKARIMNTAFPVGIETSNYSVFDTGAGFIDPWRALTQDAFATAEVNIPWEVTGNFDVQTMSSLSFGVVAQGNRYSDELTIEVHGSGTWTPTVIFNHLQPNTQFVLVEQTATTFTYRFEFSENAPIGISDGNIILTNGTESITLPFAVNYATVPDPVEVHVRTGITRPIVSNFVRTTANEQDPRSVSSETIGAVTPSNLSNAFFGFTDPNISPTGRVVEFYYVQYDEAGIEIGFWYVGAFNFPQGSTLLLTDFVAGVLNQTALPEGVFTFYAFINDTWHPQEVEIGRFIATDRRPEITFSEEITVFDGSMSYIPIEAQVYSWAHELAIAEEIRSAAMVYTSGPDIGQNPIFDYRFTWFGSEEHVASVAPNGSVRFNANIPQDLADFVTPNILATFTVIEGDVLQNTGDGSTYIGAHVSTAVPVYVQLSRSVIAEGQFTGATGSEWRLYADGTLEVDAGNINWTRSSSPWHVHRAGINRIVFTGPITAGPSLRALFRDLTEVEAIEGLTYFDTSQTADMSNMFRDMVNLSALDVSSFDTRHVMSMDAMFMGASGLSELDVSHFVTDNVIHMGSLFRGLSNVTELEVTNFNTGRVITMANMYREMSRLEGLDLSSFNTRQVTDMRNMLNGMPSLRELTLGEEFEFVETAHLQALIGTSEFTGRWIHETEGIVFSSSQLMRQFDRHTMAGTWIWQLR